MTGDVRLEGAQTGVFQTPEGRWRRWSDSNKRLDARQIGVAQQPIRGLTCVESAGSLQR